MPASARMSCLNVLASTDAEAEMRKPHIECHVLMLRGDELFDKKNYREAINEYKLAGQMITGPRFETLHENYLDPVYLNLKSSDCEYSSPPI